LEKSNNGAFRLIFCLKSNLTKLQVCYIDLIIKGARLKYLISTTFLILIISSNLKAFQQKYLDKENLKPAPNKSHFSYNEIINNDFVTIKNQEWSACKQNSTSRPYAGHQQSLSRFMRSQNYLKNLEEIERLNLLEGEVSQIPWSGDYWPYAKGLIAFRYADRLSLSLLDWKGLWKNTQDNPFFLLKTQPQKAKKLAPSEKYDWLVGSENQVGDLTTNIWQQVNNSANTEGRIESWMGLCHGWAPAAIVEKKPMSNLELLSSDKEKISFEPSDIKALLTYMWANNSYSTDFLGTRCNEKNPKRDENGRIINPGCFDLNPAVWHLVVVNLIGQQKRSFVMDATFDYEVWNQPMLGYSYSYFNPKTNQETQKVSEATVKRSDLENDKFMKYRDSRAVSLVGIKMKVGYVVETQALTLEMDSEQEDEVRWVNYEYDLELDSSGNIIGGEWHSNTHPDFVWSPSLNANPVSPYDRNLNSSWSLAQPFNNEWKTTAATSSKYGFILKKVMDAISGGGR